MNQFSKIIFAGTPAISQTVLAGLILADYKPILVLTQPDRRSGRGMQLTKSPVKITSEIHNINVLQPEKLKNNSLLQKTLADLQPDMMIVVAYGMIIPNDILEIPKYGCINIHFSLLPKWRGASPIQHSILNGDTETGVTIIQMDSGLDTGEIICTDSIPIQYTDNSHILADKLSLIGLELLLKLLNNYTSYNRAKQVGDNSYASKITKMQAKINWNENANLIFNKIRAYNPSPVAFTFINDILYKILSSALTDETSDLETGSILLTDTSMYVVCGNKMLLSITEIQIAGGKCMKIKDFLITQRAELNNKQFVS